MSEAPSIKGSVYAAAIEDVAKLVGQGELTRDEAKRWLDASDLEALASEISVAGWYDIASYDRLNRLLRDVEGGGSNEYLREKGRGTARRLIQMGIYSQMEHLQRTEVVRSEGAEERFAAFGRDLRRLTTISASILNFTSWAVHPDPERERRYRIDVSEAAEMPETLVWRTDGFVNEMASQHRAADLWSWTREHRDRIVFRMKREI